jgi:hypothetical protein
VDKSAEAVMTANSLQMTTLPAVFLVERGMWSHHRDRLWCFWDLLRDALVRTMAVVMPYIAAKNPLQMACIHD